MSIDSYRFLDFAARQVVKAWAARQRPGMIPFTPLTKALGECTVALVSTAGVARTDDLPFDQEHERRNPWWGDPRVAGSGSKRVERSASAAYRGTSDKEAMAVGEPPHRSHSEGGVGRLTRDLRLSPCRGSSSAAGARSTTSELG
jgi:hypothetical protein